MAVGFLSMLGHLCHPWLTCSASHAGRDQDSVEYGQVMSHPLHSDLQPQLGLLHPLLLFVVSLANNGSGESNPWTVPPNLYGHQKGEKRRTRAGPESVY